MARVHVDTWRSTYGGIVPKKHLAGLSYRDRESKWFDILTTASPNTSNFVAETESGDVVGFADGGPEREGNQTYRGELYAVYVLERYQRRGVGHRLVSAVAQRLISDGMYSMLVWVLQGNGPACRFYESLGGQRVGSPNHNDLVERTSWRCHTAGRTSPVAEGLPFAANGCSFSAGLHSARPARRCRYAANATGCHRLSIVLLDH